MERPTIPFLQETKCSSEDLETFGGKFWKGAKVAALDATGSVGGLGFLWNLNLVILTNLITSHDLMSAYFHILGTTVKGVITNVYGLFQLAQKPTFLEELQSLREWVGKEHWIISRDFNLIRYLEEKKGGIRTLSNISASFNKMIEELQLVDVRTTNGYFTWQNKHSRTSRITSCLDKFLVLESTLVGEGEIWAIVMPAARFDHWPICLEWG
jgi:hypothetical protein